MRVLGSLVFVAACAHSPPEAAVTLVRPAATLSEEPVDHTQERITAAKEDIAAERYDAASHALLAIVCGGREVRNKDDLDRCPPQPFVNTAEAWGLVGELALKNKLQLASNDWSTAQRLVVRWGGSKQPALELAEIALDRAVRQSGSVKYAFTLATTREKLQKWGPALDAFVKVLESSSGAHQKEAMAGAAQSIAMFDWNADGENDDVIGFDRPEVRNALAVSKQPWVPELYTRGIDTFIDERECAAARAGLAQLAQRFPAYATVTRLQSAAQSCQP